MNSAPQKIRVSGRYQYRPWPEMRHAARTLVWVADTHPEGSTHVITAAVVLTAFSVEAFCQQVGPEILKEGWLREKRPMERAPVLEKLKLIGREVRVEVDYGKSPWAEIKQLMEARDNLAHPQPEERLADRTITIPADADPREALHIVLDEKYKPLHSLEQLRRVADLIDDAFSKIWIAAGRKEVQMNMFGGSVWSMGLP